MTAEPAHGPASAVGWFIPWAVCQEKTSDAFVEDFLTSNPILGGASSQIQPAPAPPYRYRATRASPQSLDIQRPPMIEDLLLPDRSLKEVRPEIHSALSSEVGEALYDSRAERYDQIVGSWLYNRLTWGVSTKTYHRFVRRALKTGEGPFLDVGAGSAVFTAEEYARTSRPLILVDRAVGMLEAARDRIIRRVGGSLPDRILLLQADALDLPLLAERMETVLSMGLLHVVDDMATCAEELVRVLSPGGALFATALVTERAVGRQYLRLLHKAGEVATPMATEELRERVEAALGRSIDTKREGNMAFLSAEKPFRTQEEGSQ